MGLILVIILLTILVLILWLPTLIKLLIRKATLKKIVWFLFLEILVAVGTIAILDIIGVTNPASYIFLSVIVVSLGGFFCASFKRVK